MDAEIGRLRDSITRVFLGNRRAVDRVIVCLLARGHVLIEDVPGVGKTVLATALAKSIDCSFARIQLTPDMLPTDVIGVSIFEQPTGRFVFKHGPVFANIVLADEINRTTPRTQSALLEAMNEATVSVDGITHRLEQPFMVIATQNPYEFEGTYLLPENQLDRFLMRTRLGYPSADDEARVLDLRPASNALPALEPVMHKADVIRLQAIVDSVRIDRSVLDYIVALAKATREHEDLRVGVSPRGSMALAQVARASATLAGRDYAVPDDIVEHFLAVCAHRVSVRHYHRESHAGEQDSASRVLESILQRVPSPA